MSIKPNDFSDGNLRVLYGVVAGKNGIVLPTGVKTALKYLQFPFEDATLKTILSPFISLDGTFSRNPSKFVAHMRNLQMSYEAYIKQIRGKPNLLDSFLDALYIICEEIDGNVNASSISWVLQQLRVQYTPAVLEEVMEDNGFVDEQGVFAYDVDSFRGEMNTLLKFDLTNKGAPRKR